MGIGIPSHRANTNDEISHQSKQTNYTYDEMQEMAQE